MEADFEDEVE